MTRRVFVAGRFLETPNSAVNQVARHLTSALSDRAESAGWEVTVLVPPAVTVAAKALGLPVVAVPGPKGAAWDQVALPRFLCRGVVLGLYNTVPLRGRGYVTMLHDAHVFDTPQSYPRSTAVWRRHLSRQAGKQGNHVITVSDHARHRLLAAGIGARDRISVVHNGPGPVVAAVPDTGILAQQGLRHRRYVLGFSAPQPHKNTPLLLDLARCLDPSVPVVLVGPPPEKVPPQVRCLGRVSDGALRALIEATLVVCVPSTHEGFGLPALEAMALGTPVIVSNAGALPEVVGDAGIILPPHDMPLWADAVQRLAMDPDQARQMAQAGQARAQRFTWASAAQAVLRVLDQTATVNHPLGESICVNAS